MSAAEREVLAAHEADTATAETVGSSGTEAVPACRQFGRESVVCTLLSYTTGFEMRHSCAASIQLRRPGCTRIRN
jgi:hypothetical protein